MKTRHGTARWILSSSEDFREGTALLRIETDKGVESFYWVWRGRKNGETVYRLKNRENGKVYEVLGGDCTCPDAVNGNHCKHARALGATLARQQPLPEPPGDEDGELARMRYEEHRAELGWYQHGYNLID